jgi:Ca2+-binding RTX toxin-like protein
MEAVGSHPVARRAAMVTTIAVLACAAAAAPASALSRTEGWGTFSRHGDAILYVAGVRGQEVYVHDAENGEAVYGGILHAGHGCRWDTQDTVVRCPLHGMRRLVLVGGRGPDTFHGGNHPPDLPITAHLGGGNDNLSFPGHKNDRVWLGRGDDMYGDYGGNDHVHGGPGKDSLGGECWEGACPGAGRPGSDVFDAGPGDDYVGPGRGPGTDVVSTGPGDDLVIGGPGRAKVDGGPGNDSLGGDPTNKYFPCWEDRGPDVLRGGPGADDLCAAQGRDRVSGGAGPDRINTLDGEVDAGVSCGPGADALWADKLDPVGLDCEQQGQGGLLSPLANILPVRLPCLHGRCLGALTLFVARNATKPRRGALPSRKRIKVTGRALGQRRFSVRGGHHRSVRLKLSRKAARRLRGHGGATTLQARIVVRRHGHRRLVRRMFRVRPR